VIVLAREARKVDLDVTQKLEQGAHCKTSAKFLKEAIEVENLVCFHLWGKLVDTSQSGTIVMSHFLILLLSIFYFCPIQFVCAVYLVWAREM
jgi:hypothetical protein